MIMQTQTPNPGLIADHSAHWDATPQKSDKDRALTEREAEVAFAICEGKTNKEIASKLFISVKTVEKHRQSLSKAWGVHSGVEILLEAIARGHYVVPVRDRITDTMRLEHHLQRMAEKGVSFTRADIDRSIIQSRIVAPVNPYEIKL